MPDDVLERAWQRAKTKRLPDDVCVQRYHADERLPHTLLDHPIELVNDHVGEFPRIVLALHDLADVIEFHRIGYVEDLPAGGAEPDRLIIARPVEHVFVAGGRQQIERDIGFDGSGAEPALRRASLVPAYGFGRVLDQPSLVGFPQAALAFGVGAPVTDDVVTASPNALEDFRMMLVDQAVDDTRAGQFELVEQVEQAPDADAIAVVAPSEIALVRRLARHDRIRSHSCAEGEDLDIRSDPERQALAARPGIVRATIDWRIRIPVVLRDHCIVHPVDGRTTRSLADLALRCRRQK